MAALIAIVVTALAVSAICSVLEASLLSSSVIRLTKRRDSGDKAAGRLLEIKEERLDDAIGAILTYNTIAHTIGAALAGAQAAKVFGDVWVGVFSAILTLLILVFTEILPKTFGAAHAESPWLVKLVGALLVLMIKPPMKWILVVTRKLTNLIARDAEARVLTRGDLEAMVQMASRDGAIASDESRVLSNLLRFETITVDDVMTPRTVLAMAESGLTVEQMVAREDVQPYSRVPIFKQIRDQVEGYVLMSDVLRAALNAEDRLRPISEFTRPIPFISESLSVGKALKYFTEHSTHLAMVQDDLGVVGGLVTMEDLIETALGVEIVDERDRVADLRKVAMELRDKRMARMRSKQKSATPSLADQGPSMQKERTDDN